MDMTDITARNQWQETPLHLAKTPEKTTTLVKAGADVKAIDESGRTALHAAKSKEAVASLIEAGADINARDNWGRTPLHSVASGMTASSAIDALIDAGSEIDALDSDGNTALHKCNSQYGASKLLFHGADVDAKNAKGQTPDESSRSDRVGDLVRYERTRRQKARTEAAASAIENAFAQPQAAQEKGSRGDIQALAERHSTAQCRQSQEPKGQRSRDDHFCL